MAGCLKRWRGRGLPANPHGAEAQNYVTAVGGATKTEHRAEAGKHQDLIELMTRLLRRRTRKNFVAVKLPSGVNADIHKQSVGHRSIAVARFRSPGFRIVRQGEQLGGTHQVDGGGVRFHGAHGEARSNHLKNYSEDHDGGDESTGGGKRKRARHVVQQHFRVGAHFAQTSHPGLLRLHLRGGHFDAHGQVWRRNTYRNAGKQNRKLTKTLQLAAARPTVFQMPAHLNALFDVRRAGDGVVEIAGQFALYNFALHWERSLAELVRSDIRGESCRDPESPDKNALALDSASENAA